MTEDRMHEPARVTIGVPVYNGGRLLEEMLESLRRQSYRQFRVVICDNASTDDTPAIAGRFVANDPRFSYHRNPINIGAAPNFNRVWDIDHSTPYYKWAAHDDLYAPTYLERCVEVLEREPEVVVACPIAIMVDETREGHAAANMALEDAVLDSFIDDVGRPAWTIGPLRLAESDDPVRRLNDCLNRMGGSFEIFGVMRTSAVARTQLHKSYYGSDRALLAQLVLLGRFRQVAERLYTNRFHDNASRSMTREHLRTWIDARGTTRWRIAHMYWDILRAPRMAGVDILTQLRCAGVTTQNFCARYAQRLLLKMWRALGGRPVAGTGAAVTARANDENVA